MTVMESELTQTVTRTNNLLKSADKLICECSERHSRCAGCRRKTACLNNWDKFAGLHPYSVSMREFQEFKTALEQLELEGNKTRTPDYVRITEATIGALVISISMTAVISGLWGALV